MNGKGNDLRSALELLRTMPGQLVETHVEVDPAAELSGVYRYVGAGGTVRRPTNTPVDAGPYITLGMCYATHPDTGLSDVTIHRMCIQGRDQLSIFLQPGSRHIGAMAERATELGQPLPISISIGVDPAIAVTSCFEPPTTSLGFNELSIAGVLRGEPVELHHCVSIRENCIARAEYVIEGEIQPGVRVVEDQHSHTGYAMPEFPGYNGAASRECWLIQVKAVTHREHPIMQTCIGPSGEHISMAGIPTEASIWGHDRKGPARGLGPAHQRGLQRGRGHEQPAGGLRRRPGVPALSGGERGLCRGERPGVCRPDLLPHCGFGARGPGL